MNKILILFFITLNGLAQGIGKLEFSISEIDSLSKNESCLVISHFMDGKIESKTTSEDGKTKTLGIGNFSIKPHYYSSDSPRYNTLTNKEKRKYNWDLYCNFISADYISKIIFDDGSSTNANVKFYYQDKKLFYVKYLECTTVNKIKQYKMRSFFQVDIDKELMNDIQLKNWVIDQNNEILKRMYR